MLFFGVFLDLHYLAHSQIHNAVFLYVGGLYQDTK